MYASKWSLSDLPQVFFPQIPDDKVEVSSLGIGSSSGSGGGTVPFSPSFSSPRWTSGTTSSDDIIARTSGNATPPGPGGSSRSRQHSQRMSDLTTLPSIAHVHVSSLLVKFNIINLLIGVGLEVLKPCIT